MVSESITGMDLLDRLFGKPPKQEEDEEDEEPKYEQKTKTETFDVTREFTQYRVTIEYSDGETDTKYVSYYNETGDALYLRDHTPTFTKFYKQGDRHGSTPGRHHAGIKLDKDEPTIIPYSTVKNIDITDEGTFVHIIQDVEYEVVCRTYNNSRGWREVYRCFEADEDRDYEEEMATWHKAEWEAENE